MQTLFLDLASHSTDPQKGARIACCDENEIKSMRLSDHRMNDADILPMIEGTLKDAGWTYADLTRIACVVGPGGFTSLRMAVSLANALGDQLMIPTAGVHLSDLYAARYSSSSTKDFLWLHSTKKDALFVRGFGSYAHTWLEPTLIPLEALKNVSEADYIGELIPDHRAAVPHLVDAPLMAMERALPVFLASIAYDRQLLKPWYGRGY